MYSSNSVILSREMTSDSLATRMGWDISKSYGEEPIVASLTMDILAASDKKSIDPKRNRLNITPTRVKMTFPRLFRWKMYFFARIKGLGSIFIFSPKLYFVRSQL